MLLDARGRSKKLLYATSRIFVLTAFFLSLLFLCSLHLFACLTLRMNITPSLSMLLPWLWLTQTYAFSIRNSIAARQRRFSALNAAPKRLEDNVEGVVYVNEKVRAARSLFGLCVFVGVVVLTHSCLFFFF